MNDQHLLEAQERHRQSLNHLQVVYWFRQGAARELSPDDKQVEYDVAQFVLQSAVSCSN